MEPQIVRSESLAQQVYRYLRHSILTGNLNPGQRIVETRIAADLNTSRSPVREALQLLISESLITEVDGVLQVFNPSIEDFRELYELRIALESEAARLAASRVSPDILDEMENNINETRKCVDNADNERLIPLNNVFHHLVLKSSGNSRILQARNNIEGLINYYSYLIFRKNNMQTNIVAEHTEILQNLKAMDAEAAYNSMYQHIAIDLTIVKPWDQQKQAQSESVKTGKPS